MSDAGETSKTLTRADAPADTFCVNLWKHLRLESGGEGRVCCSFTGPIYEDGAPMSVDQHSLAEIWNSQAMQAMRRDMVEGRPVTGCESCYADEAAGGLSMRQRDNASFFEQGWLNQGRVTLDELIAATVENGFRVPTLPASLEIEVGNLCNFKCRMCSGHFSTLIGKDPVHRHWTADQFSSPHHDPAVPPSPYNFRRANALTRVGGDLAAAAGEVKRITFIGGEPFLVREVKWLLESLVASGRAGEIALLFITNGSVIPPWIELATHFARVDLTVSVDGYGEHYDYIRYPGRWSEFVERLQRLRSMPNIFPTVTTTLQVNNALNITRLFRHLDTIGVGFSSYLLHWPRYLTVGSLPGPVRRRGAMRLRDYAENDCLPQNRELILSLAAQFEAGDDAADPGLLRDFMLFTNDLDASRGQSIHEVEPELVELLADAGYLWPDATVHAALPASA